MRILLDLQGCQSPGSKNRGIGRYSMALAKAIVREKGNHDVYLLLNSLFDDEVLQIKQEFQGLLGDEKIIEFEAPWPVMEVYAENLWRRQVAELIREYAIAEINPDIVHVSSLFEGYSDNIVTSVGRLTSDVPTIVTLYDLIPLFDTERYLPSDQEKEWYRRKIESLKHANLLLAISESSKKEAKEKLGISPKKIVNISSAVNNCFVPRNIEEIEKTSIYQRYGIQDFFIMSAGVVESRKNLVKLIEAFALLPRLLREKFKLVLVGNVQDKHRVYLEKYAKKNGFEDGDMVFTGYVNDDELISLYNLCYLFVFPSIHEGFGLPVLEAMSCGAAVIGSNTSSIPEVICYEDALFDPSSSESISKLLEKAMMNKDFINILRRHASKQSTKFSWDVSAKSALNAFEDIYEAFRKEDELLDSSNKGKAMYMKLLKLMTQQNGEFTEQDLLNAAASIATNQRRYKACS